MSTPTHVVPAESYVHTKGLNMVDDSKVLTALMQQWTSPYSCREAHTNDTTGAIGIINWVYPTL